MCPAWPVLQHRAHVLNVDLPRALALFLWQNYIRSCRPQRNHSSAFLPLCTRKGWLNACNFPPSVLGCIVCEQPEEQEQKAAPPQRRNKQIPTAASSGWYQHLPHQPCNPTSLLHWKWKNNPTFTSERSSRLKIWGQMHWDPSVPINVKIRSKVIQPLHPFPYLLEHVKGWSSGFTCHSELLFPQNSNAVCLCCFLQD